MVIFAAATLLLSRKTPAPALPATPAFSTGDSAQLEKGTRLYLSVADYIDHAACLSSRDYDNATIARRYAQRAESAGQVVRAREASAYAVRQENLACSVPSHVTDETIEVAVAAVAPVTVTYEGLAPNLLASQPQVIQITRRETMYGIEVNGSLRWAPRLTPKKK